MGRGIQRQNWYSGTDTMMTYSDATEAGSTMAIIDCPNCRGTGQVLLEPSNNTYTHRCPKCDGRGWIWEGQR